MGQLIKLEPRSVLEKAELADSKQLKPKSLNDYVNQTLKTRGEVTKIIESEGIVKLSDLEFLSICKMKIRDELLKKGQMDENLFPCCDYVGTAIHDCVMGKFTFDKYTQDYIEESDFKGAGDINLLKYIYMFDKRRHEPNSAKDYIERASTMYYNAYTKGQMELGYLLSNNLEPLDSHIGLHGITQRLFNIPVNI